MSDTARPTCAMCGLRDGDPYCDECARLAHAVDHAPRPAIDRAIERDHSLCGAEPCSDCR